LFAVEHDAEWRRFAEAVLEQPDLGDDPRFATNVARLAHREEVDSLVGDAVARLDAADAVAMFDDLGLAYASLNDMRDVSEHPVAAERRLFDAADTATGAAVITLVGLAERLGASSLNGRARPPALGEDTEAILSELDLGMAWLSGEAS
jgi:formyl-CoA transferase